MVFTLSRTIFTSDVPKCIFQPTYFLVQGLLGVIMFGWCVNVFMYSLLACQLLFSRCNGGHWCSATCRRLFSLLRGLTSLHADTLVHETQIYCIYTSHSASASQPWLNPSVMCKTIPLSLVPYGFTSIMSECSPWRWKCTGKLHLKKKAGHRIKMYFRVISHIIKRKKIRNHSSHYQNTNKSSYSH